MHDTDHPQTVIIGVTGLALVLRVECGWQIPWRFCEWVCGRRDANILYRHVALGSWPLRGFRANRPEQVNKNGRGGSLQRFQLCTWYCKMLCRDWTEKSAQRSYQEPHFATSDGKTHNMQIASHFTSSSAMTGLAQRAMSLDELKASLCFLHSVVWHTLDQLLKLCAYHCCSGSSAVASRLKWRHSGPRAAAGAGETRLRIS